MRLKKKLRILGIKDFNDSKVATYGLKGSAQAAGTRSSNMYTAKLLDI